MRLVDFELVVLDLFVKVALYLRKQLLLTLLLIARLNALLLLPQTSSFDSLLLLFKLSLGRQLSLFPLFSFLCFNLK